MDSRVGTSRLTEAPRYHLQVELERGSQPAAKRTELVQAFEAAVQEWRDQQQTFLKPWIEEAEREHRQEEKPTTMISGGMSPVLTRGQG